MIDLEFRTHLEIRSVLPVQAERVLRRKLERHLSRAGLVIREGRAADVPALEELCRAANMYGGLDSLPAHFAALLRQPTFKSLVALDAVSGQMVRAHTFSFYLIPLDFSASLISLIRIRISLILINGTICKLAIDIYL